MSAHGRNTDYELIADFFVAGAIDHQSQHFFFAGGEQIIGYRWGSILIGPWRLWVFKYLENLSGNAGINPSSTLRNR